MNGFISGFDEDISKTKIFFMQSDGGMCHLDVFRGSRAILSGPAGGVVGFSALTDTEVTSDINRAVIGFDMGGTSTDVSRYDRKAFQHIFNAEIAGVQIQTPHLDINTVAAGGGSRLFFENGLFRVGPESAGANPGPVCYGKKG